MAIYFMLWVKAQYIVVYIFVHMVPVLAIMSFQVGSHILLTWLNPFFPPLSFENF
jgi:hypothetical protein